MTYNPSNLKFVPEFHGTGIMRNETKRDIYAQKVIGLVIYGGRHCRRANNIQTVPAGHLTQVAVSTGKHSTMSLKARFYRKAVEVYYIPKTVTHNLRNDRIIVFTHVHSKTCDRAISLTSFGNYHVITFFRRAA